MTPKQVLQEIHKELEGNSRLRELLKDYGRLYADTALRRLYSTNEAAVLIRQAGMAEGAENIINDLTQRNN